MPITHQDLISTSSPSPSTRRPDDQNMMIVQDIADALKDPPPPAVTGEYLRRCERAAAYVGSPTPGVSTSAVLDAIQGHVLPPDLTNPWANVLDPRGVDGDLGSNELVRNSAFRARNNVFDFVNRVSSFAARARAAGLRSPDSPFVTIAQLNTARPGFRPLDVDQATAEGLVFAIAQFVDLLRAEATAALDIDRAASIVQISSISTSFEGFGGSGDSSVDVLRFLPDMDALAAQRARESLAVLDFKKRVPRIVATVDYVPDGELKGCIVVWQRMSDSSGYILRRRSIFDGREFSVALPNEQAEQLYLPIKDYVSTWIMSFYDALGPDQVLAYLDRSIEPNLYYVYSVRGYQVHRDEKDSIFGAETSSANASQSQRAQVREIMSTNGAGQASPYPALAQVLLGDPDADWILAGVNTRGSLSRLDARSTTRSYSYLNARLDFLFSQMDAGKFLVPRDQSRFASAVGSAIAAFGVSQVLQDVLQGTGTLFFFDGREPSGDEYFNLVGTQGPLSSTILAKVLSAVDPETLSLNLAVLAALLGSSSVPNVPSEIPLAPFSSVPQGDYADLTTFEGIGLLMRTLRSFSDAGNVVEASIVPASPGTTSVPPQVPQPDPPSVPAARATSAVSRDQASLPTGATVVPSTRRNSPPGNFRGRRLG